MGLLDLFGGGSSRGTCQCSGCANCNKSERYDASSPKDGGSEFRTRYWCTRTAKSEDSSYCSSCSSSNDSSSSSHKSIGEYTGGGYGGY